MPVGAGWLSAQSTGVGRGSMGTWALAGLGTCKLVASRKFEGRLFWKPAPGSSVNYPTALGSPGSGTELQAG